MPPSSKKRWSAREPPRRHRSPNTCLQAPGNTLLLSAVFHCKNTIFIIFLQNSEKPKNYVLKKLFKQLQTIANAIGKTQIATIFARAPKRPNFCFPKRLQHMPNVNPRNRDHPPPRTRKADVLQLGLSTQSSIRKGVGRLWRASSSFRPSTGVGGRPCASC